MHALVVIILLATLVLPSEQAHASPPSDTSRADLQTQATQGVAEAQTNLGLLYYYGRGVPRDYTKAREWFEKAAAQGDADAHYNLGVLYDFEKGVPQDFSRRGTGMSKPLRRGTRVLRTTLEGSMNSDMA